MYSKKLEFLVFSNTAGERIFYSKKLNPKEDG
jgi:hypothetical protein